MRPGIDLRAGDVKHKVAAMNPADAVTVSIMADVRKGVK
jgi:hypothetical protein